MISMWKILLNHDNFYYCFIRDTPMLSIHCQSRTLIINSGKCECNQNWPNFFYRQYLIATLIVHLWPRWPCVYIYTFIHELAKYCSHYPHNGYTSMFYIKYWYLEGKPFYGDSCYLFKPSTFDSYLFLNSNFLLIFCNFCA